MPLLTRSAVVQARLRPEIKYASERVLKRIGLTMTEAMELFLRRLIVDQRLPFEVAAIDDATLSMIAADWEADAVASSFNGNTRNLGGKRSKRQKRE